MGVVSLSNANSKEVGNSGKIYLKLDGGYNIGSGSMSNEYKLDSLGGENKTEASNQFNGKVKNSIRATGATTNLGLGYYVTDNIRSEVNLGISNSKSTSSIQKFEFEEPHNQTTNILKDNTYQNKIFSKESVLTANLYYDFINKTKFTPYVMSGVGLLKEKDKIDYTTKVDVVEPFGRSIGSVKKTSTSFVYQVGVGAGYELSDKVLLDLGYKLKINNKSSYKTKLELKPSDAAMKDESLIEVYILTHNSEVKRAKLTHSIAAGIRFIL